MALSFRERVLKYYKLNAPEKQHEADTILGEGAFSEVSLVAALAAKYGMDRSATSRTPQSLRSNLIDLHFIGEEKDEVKKRKNTLQVVGIREESDEEAPMELHDGSPGRSRTIPFDGGPLVSQLVLDHLEVAGMPHVASSLRSELQLRGAHASAIDPAQSPVNIQTKHNTTSTISSESWRCSVLTHLLCPGVGVRESCSLLLKDASESIREVAVGRASEAIVAAANAMAQTPMWSESALLSKAIFANPSSGKIRAATLNQLVERITAVTLRSHAGSSQEQIVEQENLMMSVILTHPHFTSSKVLLAKLFQRFFVPATLPFALTFDRHSIVIDLVASDLYVAEPLATEKTLQPAPYSTRTQLWIMVTREVQIRVACCLAFWMQEAPHHFDEKMLTMIHNFVEEQLLVPTIWSDSPTALFQCAELINLKEKELRKGIGADGTNSALAFASGKVDAENELDHSLFVSPAARLNSKKETINFLFAKQKSTLEAGGNASRSVNTLSTLGPLTKAITASHKERSSQAVAEQDRIYASRLDTLFDVDDVRLANQLTAIDHTMLRQIPPSNLFVFAASSSVLRVQTTNHPAQQLNAFIHRSEDMMFWVVTEVLIAARLQKQLAGTMTTQSDDRTLNPGAALIGKFVSLAFRLLEFNNIHAAFAILCGLRHPALVRLGDLWSTVTPIVSDGFSELCRFFNFESEGYRKYKEYLASIPDTDVYPVVPLLQVWIDEVRKLEGTVPSMLRDQHGRTVIHWRKFEVLATIYLKLVRYQRAYIPSEFEAIEQSVQWIQERLSNSICDNEKLLEMSFAVATPRKVGED